MNNEIKVITYYYQKRKVYTVTVELTDQKSLLPYEATSFAEAQKVANFVCSTLTLCSITYHRFFGGVMETQGNSITAELALGSRLTSYRI